MKLCALLLSVARCALATVGFDQLTIADPPSKPLDIGVWYPSNAPTSSQALAGIYTQVIARRGAISGRGHPMVVISHGNNGSLASLYDTAIALAQAGFVAATVTHTGDNFQDQSYVRNGKNLIDRPRQMRRLVDYMLKEWPSQDRIDLNRIGILDHSLGGFTALVAIGGIPDLTGVARLCKTKPDAPECAFVKQNQGDVANSSAGPPPVWQSDPRIKAAVIAAPAVVVDFDNGGLRAVKVPVQLWRAEQDNQAPDGWNSKIVREQLPSKPDEHLVKNASHMAFIPCSDVLSKTAPFVCQDPTGFDRAKFHQEFNLALVTFFEKQLARR